jgi:hypothetical protein
MAAREATHALVLRISPSYTTTSDSFAAGSTSCKAIAALGIKLFEKH